MPLQSFFLEELLLDFAELEELLLDLAELEELLLDCAELLALEELLTGKQTLMRSVEEDWPAASEEPPPPQS